MTTDLLFPFASYWWFYLVFLAFVGVLLALDLGVFHREAHKVSFKEAAVWSIVWAALALLFNLGFYFYAQWKFGAPGQEGLASRLALEFLTGYVVEKSLAVDNIFVFVMIFGYFAIPPQYQHRILFFGIIGALVFRALFIAAGSALMQYHWAVYLFGAFLIFTGIKMMIGPEHKIEPEKNPLVKLIRRFFPVTPTFDGSRLFTRLNGRWAATPLFVALVFIEFSDIVFAVDSVPAIFAVTKEPLIVFTSNIFAILGLRSMYFLLAGVVEKFHLLKYGLACVLVFVGLKMVWLNDAFDGKFPITWSLGLIASFIGAAIALSFVVPHRESVVPHPK